jgi:hypothetical protein
MGSAAVSIRTRGLAIWLREAYTRLRYTGNPYFRPMLLSCAASSLGLPLGSNGAELESESDRDLLHRGM